MRTIKFRAWDKEGKKWIEELPSDSQSGYFLRLDGSMGIYSEDGDFMTGSYIGEDIELMQFTGLTDKNGKEIYEGDIVKYCTEDQIGQEWEHEGPVYWNENECAYWVGDGNLKIHLSNGKYTRSIEVIGNQYENPELIK